MKKIIAGILVVLCVVGIVAGVNKITKVDQQTKEVADMYRGITAMFGNSDYDYVYSQRIIPTVYEVGYAKDNGEFSVKYRITPFGTTKVAGE